MFNFNIIQSNCRRNFCVALILFLVSLIFTQKFAAQDIFAPQSADILNRSVTGDSTIIKDTSTFDKLIDKAQKSGRIRVIVGVNAKFVPEGNLRETEAVNIQRDSIQMAQNQLLMSLDQFTVKGIKQFDFIPFMAFETDAAALEFMKNSPDVTFIQEDEALKATLLESTKQIGADVSWNAGLTGSGYTIAILDSGVDKNHSFLSGKVVSEACYSSTGTDSSGNSFSSLCPGGVSSSTASGSGVNCPTSLYDCDHGTHVAGIAAGKSTTTGFNGVAKDSNIIAVQVFTKNTTNNTITVFTSDMISGLNRVYALRSSYNIAAVNMSLGGGGFTSNCDTLYAATKTAIDNLRSVNIATVIASGNDGYINGLSAPGCISSAISVGSVRDGGADVTTGSVDTVSSFSNSASFLSLLAPGETITSSVPGGSYANKDGTSMATPHVAGAWAIMKQSMGSGATVQQILDRLNNTGVSITDSRNNITKKRIRVDAAIYAGGNPSLSSYSASWNSFGGTGSFNLNIAAGYGWNALSRDSWITTSSSGTGNGTVTYIVAANQLAHSRTGTIVVAGQTFTITQDAVSCNSSVSPGSANVGGGSYSNSFAVTRAYDCGIWYPSSNASWLTITSGYSGQGNGTVGYAVASNTSTSSRTATITVTGGATFTVTQDGISCSSNLTPDNSAWNSFGGTNSFNVSRASSCGSWTAISTVDWITVTSGGGGTTGSGTVNYFVAQNSTGLSRTGTISVSGGATFTINQAGLSCSSSSTLSPPSATIGAGGGNISPTFYIPNGCTWTAASNVNWISVTSGSSGNGTGTVSLAVASNATTSQRVGTVTIGGKTFTVTQDGQTSCTYSVPSYQFVASSGGSATVAVTAPAGCPWSAVSDSNWIVIISGASGTGSGTIYLSVGANPGGVARYGNITVGGQTHTVYEYGAACTYSLAPTNFSMNSSGGAGSFSVTATDGCGWTATSSDSWLTVSAPSSGTGSGTINYAAASNTGGARSGNITVGGQLFTVNQAGSVINYEADVQNRPNGDGLIQSNDVVQVTRFVNELDTFNPSTNEFQRADSAPRTSGGNGSVDSSDIVQTIRYLNELDATQSASGPTVPNGGKAVAVADSIVSGKSVNTFDSKESGKVSSPDVAPELRVESTMGSAGNQVSINIRVDATGNEAQYAFAVLVDPNVLTFAGFAAGGTTSQTFSCNAVTAVPGRVRCSIGAFTGNQAGSNTNTIGEIAPGNNQILIKVNFTVAANAQSNSTTPVNLGSQSASDDSANSITPATTNGTVTIAGATAGGVTLGGRALTSNGRGIGDVSVTLTDAAGGTRTTRTTAFGYYRFEEVEAGQSYIITAQSKRYTFSRQTQVLNLNADNTDVNFIGNANLSDLNVFDDQL